MAKWETKATIVYDDERCTVVYPPLKWPKGARITLSWDGETFDPRCEPDDRFTLTPAGREAYERAMTNKLNGEVKAGEE